MCPIEEYQFVTLARASLLACEQMQSLHGDHSSQLATKDRFGDDTRHKNGKMLNYIIRKTVTDVL